MARKSTYRIDGDNNMFATLREAKHHIYVAYTAREVCVENMCILLHPSW